jgi:hypothetical protein
LNAALECRRQAEKMAALGRLAGDVAEDFDDLLAVIYAQLELLGQFAIKNPAMTLPIGSAFADCITKERLVRRLLAFSGRQRLVPTSAGVNDIVADVTKKIAQVYGDAVEIRTRLADDLRSAWIDVNQLTKALWNLVTNAHEAMPDGGGLTIETRNFILDQGPARASGAFSGHCVCLSISDTGTGMSEDVSTRAFEPFFSTKTSAKGLGLSQVFGFVRQSGGQISLDSEPGRGTTVRLYLPTKPVEAPALSIEEDLVPDEMEAAEGLPQPMTDPLGPAGRSGLVLNGATRQTRVVGRVRGQKGAASEKKIPPIMWHKAGDSLFGFAPSGFGPSGTRPSGSGPKGSGPSLLASSGPGPSGFGEARYRLVVEPLLHGRGWDWAVWRPGDTEDTLRHGRTSSVLEAMSAAETEAKRRALTDPMAG